MTQPLGNPYRLRITLALALATGPSLQAIAAPASATTHLTPQSVAALTLRPGRLAKAETLQQFPVEVAEAAALEYLGIPLDQVERITAIVEPPMGFSPQYALVISTAQPIKPSRVRLGMRDLGMQEEKIEERLFFTSSNPAFPRICLVDQQTAIAATPQMLSRMLESDAPQRTPLTGAMRAGKAEVNDVHGAVLTQPLKPFIDLGLMQARQSTPPQAHKYFSAAELLNGLLLSVDLTEGRGSQLNAYANNKADADKLEQLLDAAVEELKANSFETPEYRAIQGSPNQVVRAWAAYVKRSFDNQTKMFRPTRKGSKGFLIGRVEAGDEQATLQTVSVAGVLVALLLPAVQAARAAARAQADFGGTARPPGGF